MSGAQPPIISISHQDWSLHRKGPADQARHDAKVKEAIRGNLDRIVSEESIITSDGKKIIKVPIRSLDEYRFRYDAGKQQHVGQGQGGSKVGDVIGRAGQPQPGPGRGRGAGEEPGIDYYEAAISLDELAALIFEDLGLPNLMPKKSQVLESETVRFTDVRKHGVMSNLDKRRTLLQNIKRNALKGAAHVGGLTSDDLRFKTWERHIRRESNAVVLAMMDVSGSMGHFEKYVARSFYFWMVKFLRTKYGRVEIVFLAHHTEAKEVTEEEFFTRGESGGTKVSSVYQLALDIIKQRYPVSDWNIYPFHFSDGDNWQSDNELCVKLVEQLITDCNIFGYGEIRQSRYASQSTLMSAFARLTANPRFIPVLIQEKTDIYPALKRFFGSPPQRAAS
jgi:sporulation protein YhbH